MRFLDGPIHKAHPRRDEELMRGSDLEFKEDATLGASGE